MPDGRLGRFTSPTAEAGRDDLSGSSPTRGRTDLEVEDSQDTLHEIGAPDIRRVLVIKLSSLGDMIMALGAFRAIRDRHKASRLTLLTTARYGDLARRSGLFDEVWIDERPPLFRVDRWLGIALRLRRAGFDRVYDLQWSERTGWYFRLFGPRQPEWVGIAPGASHRYRTPDKELHIMERHREMLAAAGVTDVPAPDLDFLAASLERFGLDRPYALLAPGSSPARIHSRWPVDSYTALARSLVDLGLTPVLIYGEHERDVATAIKTACPQATDLEPSLGEIVSLAHGAAVAVANDTGPMHIMVHAGCPTVVLLAGRHSLKKAAPPGKSLALQADPISQLAVSQVLDAVERIQRVPCPS